MTTLVGKQKDFAKALMELCELDYDAVEAYQAAIKRIRNSLYKAQLAEFMADHEHHIREISALLDVHHQEIPKGPSAKQWLTKGKVIIANLVGDEATLKAMLSNENDTNVAYERLNAHDGKWPDAHVILERGLQDERRHRMWIEKVLDIKKAA